MTLPAAEAVIERGFAAYREAGAALAEIRKARLWSGGCYRSFAHYCRARWCLGQTQAYNIIRAAQMAEQRRAAGQSEPASIASALRIARSNGIRDPRGRKPAPVPARAPVPAAVTRTETGAVEGASERHGQATAPGTSRARQVALQIIETLGVPLARAVAAEIVRLTGQRRETA